LNRASDAELLRPDVDLGCCAATASRAWPTSGSSAHLLAKSVERAGAVGGALQCPASENGKQEGAINALAALHFDDAGAALPSGRSGVRE